MTMKERGLECGSSKGKQKKIEDKKNPKNKLPISSNRTKQ